MERDFQNPNAGFILEVIDLINETFIERKEAQGFFENHEVMLETAFLRGNCYQYAVILHTLFPNSKLGTGTLRPRDERVFLPMREEPLGENHVVTFIKVTDIDDYVAFDVKGILGEYQSDYKPCEPEEEYHAFLTYDVLTGDSEKQRETEEIIKEVLRKVELKKSAVPKP